MELLTRSALKDQNRNNLVNSSHANILPVALFLVLIIVMIKAAWVSDDSYISFRVADNFINGFGLRWNIAERVQVYTNPLWLFIVTFFYYLTGELFLTVIILSLVVSGIAGWYPLKKLSSGNGALVLGLAALISSKAFVDYTSSGLENPLNYLLSGLFFLVLFKRENSLNTIKILTLIAALATLNRMDMILLFIPVLIYMAFELLFKYKIRFWDIAKAISICSSPLWLWLIFATIYYGYPFPNTYYAKLYTGIPKMEHFIQGILYFLYTIEHDWLTLLIIALGVITSFISGNLKRVLAATGIIIYMFYIAKIGGDFMGGRFFSVPFYLSVLLIVQGSFPKYAGYVSAVLFIYAGLLQHKPALLYNENYDAEKEALKSFNKSGIVDERGFYYQGCGLLTAIARDSIGLKYDWAAQGLKERAEGKQFKVIGNAGFRPFHAGPEVHYIDKLALTDPFLSKLPVIQDTVCFKWRVGHYQRAIPPAYLPSLESGQNLFEDAQLAQLYEATFEISRGEIIGPSTFSRLKKIIKMNLGYYDFKPTSENQFPLIMPAGFMYKNIGSNHHSKQGNITTSLRQAKPTDGSGNIIYGPYKFMQPGKYKATFTLKAEQTDPNRDILLLDVFSYTIKRDAPLQEKVINNSLLKPDNSYSSFELFIDLPQQICDFETRVKYLGNGNVTVKEIRIDKIE